MGIIRFIIEGIIFLSISILMLMTTFVGLILAFLGELFRRILTEFFRKYRKRVVLEGVIRFKNDEFHLNPNEFVYVEKEGKLYWLKEAPREVKIKFNDLVDGEWVRVEGVVFRTIKFFSFINEYLKRKSGYNFVSKSDYTVLVYVLDK